MDLSDIPRVRLGHLPTPLERLDRLSARLGGPEIWIKRDDCTGLATGGNKTRKLEFLVADALALGADTLITVGATQSNHVRQTVAAACRTGLGCHALLERRVEGMDPVYHTGGNVLLASLLGCEVTFRDKGTDMPGAAVALAEDLRGQGANPYVIPMGGSNATGALGYAACAEEIAHQSAAAGFTPSAVVLASGSAGTQGGLVAGFHALGQPMRVIGMSIVPDPDGVMQAVRDISGETAARLGAAGAGVADHAEVDDTQLGPGYGQPTDAMVRAVKLMAREEGIILDPVYSGKAFAGLVTMIKRGDFTADDRVVFVHTGGTVGVFAYPGIAG